MQKVKVKTLWFRLRPTELSLFRSQAKELGLSPCDYVRAKLHLAPLPKVLRAKYQCPGCGARRAGGNGPARLLHIWYDKGEARSIRCVRCGLKGKPAEWGVK